MYVHPSPTNQPTGLGAGATSIYAIGKKKNGEVWQEKVIWRGGRMDELCKAMEELLFFQICFCQFATTRNRRIKHISHIMYLFKSVKIYIFPHTIALSEKIGS